MYMLQPAVPSLLLNPRLVRALVVSAHAGVELNGRDV